MNEAQKGIFRTMRVVSVTTDFVRDETAAEWVGSHDVEATMRARWQNSLNGPRLLDWELVELWINGQAITDETLPPECPVQQIINACTASSRMRKVLEAAGPGED